MDFGGGWTDVPPYSEREGGYVCNLAITRFAIASIAEGEPVPNERDDALVAAAVRRSGLTGIRVTVESDFPVGAGLGGSSAASAAVLGALAAWRDEPWDLRAIAEAGRTIEVEDLGVAGGRQDHYAATHGGALGLRFTDTVEIERLPLSDEFRRDLVARSVIIFTGQSRISGDTIAGVIGAYLERDRRVCAALKRVRELAEEMSGVLRQGDVDYLAALVDEHWASQRVLHPAIPTPLIDEIIACAKKNGGAGAKALGASGGGCVLIIAREGRADEVRRAVGSLGQLLEFDVALDGLKRL